MSMVQGERYLLLSYGQVHFAGTFMGIEEIGPGVVTVIMEKAVAIGETGDLSRAQLEEKYEEGQFGPVHGRVFVPWHDISKILPQGQFAKDEDERARGKG